MAFQKNSRPDLRKSDDFDDDLNDRSRKHGNTINVNKKYNNEDEELMDELLKDDENMSKRRNTTINFLNQNEKGALQNDKDFQKAKGLLKIEMMFQ